MKRGVKLLMEYIQLTVELGSLSPLFTTSFMHSKGGLIHWISELSTEGVMNFANACQGFAVQVAPSSCWISCNLTRIGHVVGSGADLMILLWVGSWYLILPMICHLQLVELQGI